MTCAWPECRQVFFLCSACDRGHRYCGQACRTRARVRSRREAGRRYQATLDGRHAHAARQRRYRERRDETPETAEPKAPLSSKEPNVAVDLGATVAGQAVFMSTVVVDWSNF